MEVTSLRVDKFLKVSHLIKRRTVAKEASLNERILVNGKICKPSKEVKVGDEVTICFGKREITVRIKSLSTSAKRENSELMYELVSEKTIEK